MLFDDDPIDASIAVLRAESRTGKLERVSRTRAPKGSAIEYGLVLYDRTAFPLYAKIALILKRTSDLMGATPLGARRRHAHAQHAVPHRGPAPRHMPLTA